MKKLTFTLTLLLICSIGFSQNISKYLQAEELAKAGKYDTAQVLYKDLLGELDKHKKNMQAKIVVSYIQNTIKYVSPFNVDYINQAEELLAAYSYFKNLDEYKLEKVSKTKLDEVNNFLHLELLNNGLNELLDKKYTNAYDLMTAYTELKPTNYIGYNILGQAEQGLGKNARPSYRKAISLFKEYPPENPDVLIGYTYYRLASISMQSNNPDNNYGLDTAIIHLSEGIATVNNEYLKLDEQAQERNTANYNDIINVLEALKLDVYLNHPGKKGAAIKEFKSAVNKHPNNYVYRISYAQLLENTNQTEAIKQYEAAIKIDSTQVHAYYNIGAIYYNNAAKLNHKLLETNSDDEYDKIYAEYEKVLKEAYPYLKKAHKIKPTDKQALSILKTIAITLEYTEDYQYYNKLYKEL